MGTIVSSDVRDEEEEEEEEDEDWQRMIRYFMMLDLYRRISSVNATA